MTPDPATQLELLREKQKWTREKPTMSGVYWYRKDRTDDAGPRIAFIRAPLASLVYVKFSDGAEFPVGEWDGEWSGPLEAPK